MTETTESGNLTPWDSLSEGRQLELREQYGHYLDSLPPTCSLDSKIRSGASAIRNETPTAGGKSHLTEPMRRYAEREFEAVTKISQ
jgi:hypothetical protein